MGRKRGDVVTPEATRILRRLLVPFFWAESCRHRMMKQLRSPFQTVDTSAAVAENMVRDVSDRISDTICCGCAKRFVLMD